MDDTQRAARLKRLRAQIKDEPRDATGQLDNKWSAVEAEISALEASTPEPRKAPKGRDRMARGGRNRSR